MTKELSLEEGIEEFTRLVDGIAERPILVAVYGWPDNGKSYFISKAYNRLNKRNGLAFLGSESAPSAQSFEDMADSPERFKNVLWLFHCAWERWIGELEGGGWIPFSDEHDPNMFAERIMNRKININICMYNPHMRRKPAGNYDIIISNPLSVEKRPVYKFYVQDYKK
jgi:hypothetical protein